MIPGHSPKLGSCQGECPYPCDYVSLFGDGDVIFLAMMSLRIRFSSSSLLTCCLRSTISFRSFPVIAKAPCTQGCSIAAGEPLTLFFIFSKERNLILEGTTEFGIAELCSSVMNSAWRREVTSWSSSMASILFKSACISSSIDGPKWSASLFALGPGVG